MQEKTLCSSTCVDVAPRPQAAVSSEKSDFGATSAVEICMNIGCDVDKITAILTPFCNARYIHATMQHVGGLNL